MSMMKRSTFPQLSFANLPEKTGDLDYFIQQDLDRATKLMIPTIKTHALDRIKTQNIRISRRASYSREKPTSFDKRLSILKENQAVPNICLGLNEKLLWPNEQLTERNIFRIKKVKNTSSSSHSKKSSVDSKQKWLENKKQDSKKEIIVIDLQGNNYSSRRRSQAKNYQPCRIANTKKLPFQLQRNKKNVDISQEFQAANISSIMKIPEENILMTQQSCKELYKFL